ncbi:MAG: hypothetical protein M3R10_04925 [Verrucomicrobiota bacterium]|nr:hypothetical protein [Verrucomicrobiota bacterium]
MSDWLDDLPCRIGQIYVERAGDGRIAMRHRDDAESKDLSGYEGAEAALEIARYDDAGNYRPLKTAPNLHHGWRLSLRDFEEARLALDYFYPGRAAAYCAWRAGNLLTTPLRDTLSRQSGMYRVAAKISDAQAEEMVANFCRSDVGCLRTILWKSESPFLPPEKFDPRFEVRPLLCPEACNLLVAEMGKAMRNSPNE